MNGKTVDLLKDVLELHMAEHKFSMQDGAPCHQDCA